MNVRLELYDFASIDIAKRPVIIPFPKSMFGGERHPEELERL